MFSTVSQVISLFTNVILLGCIFYYVWRLHGKEQILEKKEEKVDTDYHHIVDDALAKERKILEDASIQAKQIIEHAQYTSETSKKMVHEALSKMIEDVHRETLTTAKVFVDDYHSSLKQLSGDSLQGFSQLSHNLQTDLQKQMEDFRMTFLPRLEKELAAYKEVRMKETEVLVQKVVQKVAQEVLNKSLSLEDHHQLLVAALERAKKEGVFS